MKVILGKAAASPKNEKFPNGEIHAVLMFVKSDDNNKAQKIASIEMQKRNWNKVKLSRIGAVNLDTFAPEDENIQKAFDSALENRFGVSVYPEVENNFTL